MVRPGATEPIDSGGTDKYPVSPMDVVEHPVFGYEFIGIDLLPLSIIWVFV